MKKALAVEVKAVKELLSDIRSIREDMLLLGLMDVNSSNLSNKLKDLAKDAVKTLEEKL